MPRTNTIPADIARTCWPCGGSGHDINDKQCRSCNGHGRLCSECYSSLGECDSAALATNVCTECTACMAVHTAGLTCCADDACPRCDRPTHASESNDDGVCSECLGDDAIYPETEVDRIGCPAYAFGGPL